MQLFHILLLPEVISLSVLQKFTSDLCITSKDLSLTCQSFRDSFSFQGKVSLIKVYSSDNCYVLVQSYKSWSNAQSICKKASGRLVWVAFSNGTQDHVMLGELHKALVNEVANGMAWTGLRTYRGHSKFYWVCPYANGPNLETDKNWSSGHHDECCSTMMNTIICYTCSNRLFFYCELVLPQPTTSSSTSSQSVSATVSHFPSQIKTQTNESPSTTHPTTSVIPSASMTEEIPIHTFIVLAYTALALVIVWIFLIAAFLMTRKMKFGTGRKKTFRRKEHMPMMKSTGTSELDNMKTQDLFSSEASYSSFRQEDASTTDNTSKDSEEISSGSIDE